jgi:hypothetical protein
MQLGMRFGSVVRRCVEAKSRMRREATILEHMTLEKLASRRAQPACRHFAAMMCR